jgi:uncharacterized damage-inducible protein DinB
MKALFAERKTNNSKALLNSLAARVEEHIQFAVNRLQNLPEKVLLAPASNGGWSVAQCLEHLNTYGYHYLPAIEKGFLSNADLPASPKFRNSRLGQYFTYLMTPESGTKMKTAAKHDPSNELDAYAVIAEFIRQQETMLIFLRKGENTDLNKIKISISISNFLKLPLGDVLQFIVAHDARHVKQAARVLSEKSPNIPVQLEAV